MLKLYDNVISESQLERIRDATLEWYKDHKLINEHTTDGYVENSFGISNIPEAIEEIDLIKKLVLHDFGSQYEFTHAYSRIYVNGGILRLHVDRPGLDITGSLLVYDNLDKPWPLNFSNKEFYGTNWNLNTPQAEYKDSYYPLTIKPNQMAVCDGRKNPHWRDRLVCGPKQYSIHVFYHWKLIE